MRVRSPLLLPLPLLPFFPTSQRPCFIPRDVCSTRLILRHHPYPTPHPPLLMSIIIRTVYTLLPPGYIERHGGKTQRLRPPPPLPPSPAALTLAVPPQALGAGDNDAAAAAAAVKKDGAGGGSAFAVGGAAAPVCTPLVALVTGVDSGGSASGGGDGKVVLKPDNDRWLLSDDEACGDIAFMRVSRV